MFSLFLAFNTCTIDCTIFLSKTLSISVSQCMRSWKLTTRSICCNRVRKLWLIEKLIVNNLKRWNDSINVYSTNASFKKSKLLRKTSARKYTCVIATFIATSTNAFLLRACLSFRRKRTSERSSSLVVLWNAKCEFSSLSSTTTKSIWSCYDFRSSENIVSKTRIISKWQSKIKFELSQYFRNHFSMRTFST